MYAGDGTVASSTADLLAEIKLRVFDSVNERSNIAPGACLDKQRRLGACSAGRFERWESGGWTRQALAALAARRGVAKSFRQGGPVFIRPQQR